MTERRTITIEAYRRPDGKATCASNFETGEVCQFIRVRKFGTVELCAVNGKDLRRSWELGFLIPHDECPVWETGEDV